jgi:hypothetical protein
VKPAAAAAPGTIQRQLEGFDDLQSSSIMQKAMIARGSIDCVGRSTKTNVSFCLQRALSETPRVVFVVDYQEHLAIVARGVPAAER